MCAVIAGLIRSELAFAVHSQNTLAVAQCFDLHVFEAIKEGRTARSAVRCIGFTENVSSIRRL